MNKKLFAILLAAVLGFSIGVGIVLYFQNQNEPQQTGAYTVIGNLSYAPVNAIYPGVSVTSVSPTLYPFPSPRTVLYPNGQGGTFNETVNDFIFVLFTGKFTFPPNSPAPIGFPTGFEENDRVKLSGDISYNPTYQGYFMNVTGIVHYTP